MGITSFLTVPLIVLLSAALTAQALRPSIHQFTLQQRPSSASTIVSSSSSPTGHQRTVCSTLASMMAIVSLNTMMMVSLHPLAASAVRAKLASHQCFNKQERFLFFSHSFSSSLAVDSLSFSFIALDSLSPPDSRTNTSHTIIFSKSI